MRSASGKLEKLFANTSDHTHTRTHARTHTHTHTHTHRDYRKHLGRSLLGLVSNTISNVSVYKLMLSWISLIKNTTTHHVRIFI